MYFKGRLIVFIVFTVIVRCYGRPQEEPTSKSVEKFEPYEYEYKVDDQPSGNYFGQNESGKDTGRVEGSYFVYLPDGRLMTVSYYIDGESGFVPKITFQDNANPFGQSAHADISKAQTR
ncbi:pro-resilin-like [Daktulosphaira vitifoliae]|uniref:pro-resilin-like n=1 Tax=Daktulosphaira vitifoliae TaxID=58002 RepID=UPI0021A9D3D4|nr:pro-resilin-like [Daktulosphaira vitifoliae]